MTKLIKFILSTFVTLTTILVSVASAAILYFGQDLPDYKKLTNYEPPTITRAYANDYSLLGEYAIENRSYIKINSVPEIVKNAFISVEDRNFYNHIGLDARGIVRALYNIIIRDKMQGGSTITQQVAKNILLSSERTLSRKIKEAIIAIQIDAMFTKDQVLEFYLNEIYLGAGSYGVADASMKYFNKPVTELNLSEAALLAALPKAPSKYNPWSNYTQAIRRRNIVLLTMMQENYITREQYKTAIKTNVNLIKKDNLANSDSKYFSEEVRREAIKLFGRDKVYKGGLTIHTSMNPKLQELAKNSLRKGLIEYDKRHGYRGHFAKLTLKEDENWVYNLNAIESPNIIGGIEKALIFNVHNDIKIIEIGLENGKNSYITFDSASWANKIYINENESEKKEFDEIFKTGDVILVRKEISKLSPYSLFQIPKINGGIVVMEANSGKVLALSGGFSFAHSNFNRAIQAKRQPGSTFKPFVYLTALENGYKPSDLIADEPINSSKIGWSPKNHSGVFYGPTTIRKGLEKSINLMTVHLGNLIGIDKIMETAHKFDITDSKNNDMTVLLGTNETTLLKLTNAYATIANGGRKNIPYLIERVHNRDGLAIYKGDTRICNNCNTQESEPKIISKSTRIASEISTHQLTSILEGAITRGTGRKAQDINKIVAGKTGTTNNNIDSWFIGFSPDLVVGVYAGFDQPASLGKHEEGSSIALPIFVDFMKQALSDIASRPFPIPNGTRIVHIDYKTGFLPTKETPDSDIIFESFKSGTEPTKSMSRHADLPVINVKKHFSIENKKQEPTTNVIY